MKGATLICQYRLLHFYGFNSRSREGSDVRLKNFYLENDVSTLAPVKGATAERLELSTHYLVSTLAPVKGAT